MKIRIKGNSVRIRLSRPEVESFAQNGYLEERTEFGDNVFTYTLEVKQDIAALSAAYSNNKMTVFVPGDIPAAWAVNETVGYDSNMDIGGGKQLFLLLEKDFKCVDNSAEDQSDNYEHPTKTC